MQDWISDWFLTPSLNILESTWASSSLKVIQSAFSEIYPSLRYHKLQVAFYDQNGQITEVKDVTIPRNVTSVEVPFDNSQGVVAALVNYNDYTFVSNIIDDQSLSFFMTSILKIHDQNIRALIWYNISQMCQ